jgi:hypothetical protein
LYNKQQLAEMHNVSIETINECLKREELNQFLKNEKKQTIFSAEGIDLLKETIEEIKRSKIKAYLEEQRKEELIKRGLCEKVPGIHKYGKGKKDVIEVKKVIPYEITEEEFEQIMKISHMKEKTNFHKNYSAIAKITLLVGISIGFYASLGYAYDMAIFIWISTLSYSALWFAISRIISLLEDIKNKR